MSYLSAVVVCVAVIGAWGHRSKFPSTFKFGASTAAYQIEGAWNVSDKGESTWDRLVHTRPEVIADRSTGDVACDSYHLWRRDIEMAEELGLDMYRFSLSWTRILPSGYPNYVSEDGVRYYSKLIDGLLEKGIEPVVTIYHFDLPQSLQDLGGWANPLIVDWFADYARVVYSLYADRVKTWLTINEPFAICDMGYNRAHGPYLEDTKIGMYLCNKNVMMAHAKAWRIYDEEFRPKYHGKVSIVNIVHWLEPATPADKESAALLTEFWEGRYSHPIFSKEGGWPRKIEEVLAENSRKEGFQFPRLPPFTPEEKEFVKGTHDFYALNHYTTRLVRKPLPGEQVGDWPYHGSPELGLVMVSDPSWETADVDWFALYPEGLRKQLNWLNTTYGISEIIITESGYVSTDATLYDPRRLACIKGLLKQILLAIEDGVNVSGYAVWSLMDNFEWLGGESAKFGLYAVDFADPLRRRTPRESARYYASVTRSRSPHPTQDVLNYI